MMRFLQNVRLSGKIISERAHVTFFTGENSMELTLSENLRKLRREKGNYAG